MGVATTSFTCAFGPRPASGGRPPGGLRWRSLNDATEGDRGNSIGVLRRHREAAIEGGRVRHVDSGDGADPADSGYGRAGTRFRERAGWARWRLRMHKGWTTEQYVGIFRNYQSEYLGANYDFGNNPSFMEDLMRGPRRWRRM